MPPLAQLKTKYFIGASDMPSGTRVPAEHDGTLVTPIVDGKQSCGSEAEPMRKRES